MSPSTNDNALLLLRAIKQTGFLKVGVFATMQRPEQKNWCFSCRTAPYPQSVLVSSFSQLPSTSIVQRPPEMPAANYHCQTPWQLICDVPRYSNRSKFILINLATTERAPFMNDLFSIVATSDALINTRPHCSVRSFGHQYLISWCE